MKKTVCELFAGVGGFRCGLNNIKTAEDYGKEEKWDTVWFNQWEHQKKLHNTHMTVMYIDLGPDWILMVRIQQIIILKM